MTELAVDIVHQNMHQRQSIGHLVEPAPNAEQLERAFQAALTAPDHHRLKPTRFIVIAEDQREAFGELLSQALADLGETEPGLNRLIRTAYAMLGLINFFTVGEDECRAWTVHSGTKAPKAAGKIHSDIERGFIRAEIITYDELIKCGSFAAAREKGLLRVEGKEYIIKDGDIAYFRFNV